MRYRFGDLVVASGFPLAALATSFDGDPECSFLLAAGPAPPPRAPGARHDWRSSAGTVALSCLRSAEGYRLDVPEVGAFDIDPDGRTVTVYPSPSAGGDAIEHALVDQVLPRVLVHRGRLVLHAAAIEVDGGGVAFLGDSGAGKSTLCAAFSRAGRRVIGDDGIVVRPRSRGGFEAIATYPGLRLLPDTLRSFYGDDRAGVLVAAHGVKRRLPVGRAFDAISVPVPLRALFVLDRGPEVAVSPLEGGAAFVALVRGCFQLHLDDPARSGSLFERLGRLVDALPVFRLAYPRDLDALPEVRRAVTDASSAGCACS